MAKREILYQNRPLNIAYEIEGEGEDVIFLHGWGANKELMREAFAPMVGFRKVFIDLPGFGKSSNPYILTTKDYANIVELFLKELGAKKDIVIGHSFGGKVATLLEPKLLVLLSSAGIVEKKPLKIRAKIALYKMFKPLGIKKVRKFFASKDVKGMSENMYETFKNVVDEDFTPYFQSYKKRALIFWGKDDKATLLQSGEKIASLIQRSSFYPMEGDHYFFLDKGEEISKKIRQEYETL